MSSIVLRRITFTAALACLVGCDDSAPSGRSNLGRKIPPQEGPALIVQRGDLDAALDCKQPLTPGGRAVLLVHGTSVMPEENWGWNWESALPHFGFLPCTVRLPDYAFVDIQVSSEYVVHAIREMSDTTGLKIAVVGVSQGGLQPRWAIRWWPDVRERINDLVMLATPNHGALFADLSCALVSCLPALWQTRTTGSRFLDILNHADETPGKVSYTSIYSHTDVVIQPSFLDASAVLEGGVNIAVQDFCPGRVVDHAQHVYDAAVWALAIDALLHPGPLDVDRVDPAACLDAVMPHVDLVEALQRGAEVYLASAMRQAASAGKVDREPELRNYTRD